MLSADVVWAWRFSGLHVEQLRVQLLRHKQGTGLRAGAAAQATLLAALLQLSLDAAVLELVSDLAADAGIRLGERLGLVPVLHGAAAVVPEGLAGRRLYRPFHLPEDLVNSSDVGRPVQFLRGESPEGACSRLFLHLHRPALRLHPAVLGLLGSAVLARSVPRARQKNVGYS